MENWLHFGVKRTRQATACAVIVACLLPLPTSAQAQRVAEGPVVLAPGVPFNPIEPAGMAGSTRDCDASASGLWVGTGATQPSNGPATSRIRDWLAGPHGQAMTTADRVAPASQGPYRGRRGRGRSGDRAVVGLVLGAIGGFVVGGLVGAQVSVNSCHCANPELHGVVIGAPIGAVVGGFLGYALAR